MNEVSEKKKEMWAVIKSQIQQEIGDKYQISVDGLKEEDQTKFFHPVIKFSDYAFLRAQCDLEDYENGDYKYYAIYLCINVGTSSKEYMCDFKFRLKSGSFKDVISFIEKKGKTMTSFEAFLNVFLDSLEPLFSES